MGYTLEAIEQIRVQLRELPAVERKQKLNKQEAINTLVAEIQSLQKRGYRLEEITESLKGMGLDIATSTLRNYLNRGMTKRNRAPKATASATIKKQLEKDLGDTKSDTSREFMGEDRKKL